jgi:uncharacterized protein (TIGR00296 family)
MSQKQHCITCFDSIINHLQQRHQQPSKYNESYPLFVTWYKWENGKRTLRGCIGNLSPIPLETGLREYAILSATDDRFQPITSQEVPQLECQVSLLHQFQDVDWNNWEIGTHGIRIQYQHYRGTFLPNVIVEQGWNHLETIQFLLKKAGYHGIVDVHVLQQIKISRYHSSTTSLLYHEYCNEKLCSI